MANENASTERPAHSAVDSPETVLIVDDEEPVRRTFREWLEEADLGVRAD